MIRTRKGKVVMYRTLTMELVDEAEDDRNRCSVLEDPTTRPKVEGTGDEEGRVDREGKDDGLEDRNKSGREVRDARLG